MEANAPSPNRDTRPYVGFIPTTPQNEDGCLTDPPVSEPSEYGTRPAATAAAEPPDEPPGTAFVSHGFRIFLKYDVSLEPPMANSSMLFLPISTDDSPFSFSITVASYIGWKSSSMRLAHVVSTSLVMMLSLMPIGTPNSAPSILSCA